MKNKLTSKQIERRGIYNFIFAFLVVIVLFSCVSCSSTRKVDRKEQKQKIDFTENVTEEVKINTETTTKVIDTSTIDEIEIVPIDSTKPTEYNGHKVINGTLKLSKRKNNITANKVEKVTKNQQKAVKTEIVAESSSEEKETERKSGFNWWWLLLLIPIYLIYRKYGR